jgi:hypothetical protein
VAGAFQSHQPLSAIRIDKRRRCAAVKWGHLAAWAPGEALLRLEQKTRFLFYFIYPKKMEEGRKKINISHFIADVLKR